VARERGSFVALLWALYLSVSLSLSLSPCLCLSVPPPPPPLSEEKWLLKQNCFELPDFALPAQPFANLFPPPFVHPDPALPRLCISFFVPTRSALLHHHLQSQKRKVAAIEENQLDRYAPMAKVGREPTLGEGGGGSFSTFSSPFTYPPFIYFFPPLRPILLPCLIYPVVVVVVVSVLH
jgi:hypothetical protein